MEVATHQVTRLRNSGRGLSRNDVRIIVMAQLLYHLSHGESTTAALLRLDSHTVDCEAIIDRLSSREGT
jgi:hypothetical protein